MCGINGSFSKNISPDWIKTVLGDMNAAIQHRGPDDSGILVYWAEGFTVGFGQVRLSIVDLSSAGHQPMRYSKEHGGSSEVHNPKTPWDIAIVFNGEIYNFPTLKEDLASKGYVFSTHSDTEVILASYLEWGVDCVQKFNGFWAFAILDTQKNSVFFSRDRFGKKPLYYWHQENGDFAFSSEMKGLLKLNGISQKIDSEALDFYFTIGFIPAPWSIYQSVRKLESGHSATYDLKTGEFKTFRYYHLPPYRPIHDRKALIEEGRKLLEDATRIRMFADVPVGAFLSGGLDSSSVVAEMTKFVKKENLHTFSIGFEGKYDETPYITTVKNAFGTNHHHQYFRCEDFESMLEDIPHYYDEPFGDYSCFPTTFVSRLAKEYVTVALSGDGWDEIFGGYTLHQIAAQMRVIRMIPKNIRKIFEKCIPKTSGSFSIFSKLKEAFRVSLSSEDQFYAEAGSSTLKKPEIFQKWSSEKLWYCLEASNNDFVQAMIDYDLMFGTLGDNFLTKTDRASMSCALEIRSPFLDYRFVEFARKIPSKWKTNARKTKILMREIIRDIVPKSIVCRWKQGFEPPLKEWINNYNEEISCGLSELAAAGAINKQWATFFRERVLKSEDPIYLPQKIRLFLFIRWQKQWGNASSS